LENQTGNDDWRFHICEMDALIYVVLIKAEKLFLFENYLVPYYV